MGNKPLNAQDVDDPLSKPPLRPNPNRHPAIEE